MSKRSSGDNIQSTRRRPLWCRLRRDDRGSALVPFGVVLPLVLATSFGILEFTLIVFDYHRASEAARRGARQAVIGTAASNLKNMNPGQTITCSASGGGVACSGGGGSISAHYDSVVNQMNRILPAIGPENVRIDYQYSGIGDPDTPGGVMPLVRVELVNVEHEYLVLDAFPGITGTFVFAPFTTTYLANGQGQADD